MCIPGVLAGVLMICSLLTRLRLKCAIVLWLGSRDIIKRFPIVNLCLLLWANKVTKYIKLLLYSLVWLWQEDKAVRSNFNYL